MIVLLYQNHVRSWIVERLFKKGNLYRFQKNEGNEFFIWNFIGCVHFFCFITSFKGGILLLNQVSVQTIKVKEMKESLSFYTEVFDFSVSKKYSDKIVTLVHKNIPIVLEEESSINLSDSSNVLLGISSDDIHHDFNLLIDRGARVLFDEPKPCPPGYYFIVEDPSGNKIKVVEFRNGEE